MSWAHYILQVNMYLVVFYGFYKLLLDKETYFILNRIYLLAAGTLSLAIPFLRFEWFSKQPVAHKVYTGVDQFNSYVTQIVSADPVAESWKLGDIIAAIYVIGIIAFSIRFIVQLLSIPALFKNTIGGSAFSFFRKKMIDHELPEYETINKHEEIHVRQLHSLDILFFEILGIITWFNPVSHFYKATIKNIHEFLADEAAARFQGDKEQYALLLLSKAFGIAPSTLTNNFHAKSLIKKRIYMLHKRRSAKTAVLKYGLFAPLFAATLLLSSATIRNNEKIQQVAEKIPLGQLKENLEEQIIAPVANAITKDLGIDSKPNLKQKTTLAESSVAGDWQDFYEYIAKGIRFPLAAQKNHIEGTVQLKFAIKNGQIEDLGIVGKPLGAGCDAELMNTLLAYKGYATKPNGNYTFAVDFRLEPSGNKWTAEVPLKIDGYTLLEKVVVIGFAPKGTGNDPSTPINERNSQNMPPTVVEDSKVFDFSSLEQYPTFQGGMDKFYKFLSENVRYPEYAQKHNIQGKVFLSFIVEVDGSLSDITVDRKLGGGIDEEAVRILKLSPKWTPGVQYGKTVRVKYNLPIIFSLAK